MIARATMLYRLRLITLLSLGALAVMGGGLVAPALPALMEPFGVKSGSVGLVLSMYTLAAALTLPFTGLLLDVIGRKPVGIVCLLIDGLFGILCTLAPNFGTLLLFRFMQGIGIAGLVPVAMTVIGDWYHGEYRLRIMGYLSATIAIAAIAIPALAGILAEFDWRYPFLIYGVSPLLAIPFSILVPETAPRRLGLQPRNYLRNLKSAIKLRAVRAVFFYAFGTYFLLYALITFMPLLLAARYGYGVWVAGAAISLNAAISAWISTKAVTIQRKLGHSQTLVAGYLLIAFSLVLLPLGPGIAGVAISLLLFGSGMGVLQPAIFNQAVTAGPIALTGAIVALFNTVKFVGMTTAPFLLRFVFDAAGTTITFVVAGIIGGIWALRCIGKERYT